MPVLTKNVLYKGKILPAGKKISASAAKQFGDHVLGKEPKEPAEDEQTQETDSDKE